MKTTMLDDRLKRVLSLAASLVHSFYYAPAFCADTPVTEQEIGQMALQATLDDAENIYKTGKVDLAIDQATSLVDTTDNIPELDRFAREAKADLAMFQLKAGHPDQSAKLIRELLLNLQLELPIDPRYSKNSAQVLAESPGILKDYFGKVIERLDEKADTRPIIDSLIDNTVPKNYLAVLKPYCARLQATIEQLHDFQSVADTEELKYGDSLRSLDEPDSDNKSDPKLSADRLNKLGTTLNALATQAQQMPVGDLRAAVGLYRLALVANSAQRNQQAEMFAQQSIDHVTAITNALPVVPQIRLVLAYSLLKQGKIQEFNAVKDDLLNRIDDRERLLVALARFTETSGDNAGAAAVYERALDNRTTSGNTQPPDWMDNYNALLKRLSP